MNDVIKLLNSHRSIRKFTDQEIPRGLLLELIQAGQAAATWAPATCIDPNSN